MAGYIPDNIINEVLNAVDIVEIVGSRINLIKKGEKWWGLCPFHSEKTPSFTINREKNLFYCFGCGKGGSVIQFLMELESLNFPETVRQLAEKAGISIPESGVGSIANVKVKALEELYLRVSNTFQWLFNNHPKAVHARNYMESRGVSRETCNEFHIGWTMPDGEWLYEFLIDKKYSPEFLADSGLFSSRSPKWSLFINRIMFPIMPDKKRIVAFSARSLDNRGPKYINTPETLLFRKRSHIYGLGQANEFIRKSKQAYLCEGAMDVISCHQAGLKETVAPLGTAFTVQQAQILRRQADSLVCMFDGDEAGMKAAMKTAVIAENFEFNVYAISIPVGSDPADILIKQGSEALKKIASNPLQIFNFLLYYYINAYAGNSNGNQKAILRQLAPYLNAVKSQLSRDDCLKQFAVSMNADIVSVMREYNNLYHKELRTEIINQDIQKKTVEPLGDELYLMITVAVKPDFFTLVQQRLTPEVFRDRRALSIFRILEDIFIGLDATVVISNITLQIIDRIDDPHLSRMILEKAATDEFADGVEDTILEKINLLKVRTLEDERRVLINAMSKKTDKPDRNKARLIRIQKIGQAIQILEEQVKRK